MLLLPLGSCNKNIYKTSSLFSYMEESLKEFGFSERESKVYIALLELGETTTGKISKMTRLNSSKIYDILERLIDKGLVSYVLKNKIKYFNALEPQNILKSGLILLYQLCGFLIGLILINREHKTPEDFKSDLQDFNFFIDDISSLE